MSETTPPPECPVSPIQTPTPRLITDHQLANQLNNELRIHAVDLPGPGGANHVYEIRAERGPRTDLSRLEFQKGGIQEAGVNGVTNEALLAIVIDRLRSFQNGPFKCEHNQKALVMAEHSLEWLKKRTRDRLQRGVEGKSVK